jgi:hypothetical protein
LDQLRDSADEAIASLRSALREPRRVIDVFGALFSRPIGEENPTLLRMATGEAISHLNFLVLRGEAICDVDGQGVGWYRLVDEIA